MTSIATCLWFNGEAEAAARLYTSSAARQPDRPRRPAPADNPSTQEGDVLTVDFTLAGQRLHRPQRRAGVPVHRGDLD